MIKKVKDIFSIQSNEYAKYRPHYPDELFEFLNSLVLNFEIAWDAATGNGQVASKLAETFTTVYATDSSQAQLTNAIQKNNIVYSCNRAEQNVFSENKFDLITVAQAFHWFDFSHFYKEAQRVAKPNAIIALWGYNLLSISEEIDSIINFFYSITMKGYWDKERKYVDDKYQTIHFPFQEMDHPKFFIKANWTYEQLIGYLFSWSSVQKYIKKNQANPIQLIESSLKKHWEEDLKKEVAFPIFMRIGRIKK